MLKELVPARYHYLLSQIKNRIWGGYAHTYYSQFGEDIALARLLPKPTGFYVDVGAHHPTRYSNTHLLHKRGWSGINIDPNPDTIALFNRARPNDINVCAGVASGEKELQYHMFSDPAVNTFNEQEAERWKGKNWISYLGSRQVEVKPLRDILVSLPTRPVIDLLTIDAEGMDLEVLESNDWHTCTPRVIVVESDDFDASCPEQNSIFNFLSTKGYMLRGICGPSLIFDHSD